MAVNATYFDSFHLRSGSIYRYRPISGDSKFVLFQAGRYIGVGAGVYIGIYTHRYRGRKIKPQSLFIEASQLRLRFYVETVNASPQRLLNLGYSLAETRKYNLRGISASFKNAAELATRDDVESSTHSGQDIQYR